MWMHNSPTAGCAMLRRNHSKQFRNSPMWLVIIPYYTVNVHLLVCKQTMRVVASTKQVMYLFYVFIWRRFRFFDQPFLNIIVYFICAFVLLYLSMLSISLFHFTLMRSLTKSPQSIHSGEIAFISQYIINYNTFPNVMQH